VVGSGGAFDTKTCATLVYDVDRLYVGERHTTGSNPSFPLEIDNVVYSITAIGQSGRDPS